MTGDDMALETLAASEADLLRRVRSLEADVATRDEFLSVALDHLCQLTVKLERTNNSLRQLLELERSARVRLEAEAV